MNICQVCRVPFVSGEQKKEHLQPVCPEALDFLDVMAHRGAAHFLESAIMHVWNTTIYRDAEQVYTAIDVEKLLNGKIASCKKLQHFTE